MLESIATMNGENFNLLTLVICQVQLLTLQVNHPARMSSHIGGRLAS